MSGLGLTFLRRGGLTHPTAGLPYINFKDEEVFRVLMEKGVSSDGVGIMPEDAAKVTTISNWFKGNTIIKSFDELQYFTGLAALGTEEWSDWSAAFKGCTNLESVTLPPSVKRLGYHVFHGCAKLQYINLENVERMFESTFYQCTSLAIDIIAPRLSYVGMNVFSNSGVRRVLNLGSVTSLPGGWGANEGVFRKCSSLSVAIIPNSVKSIGVLCIANCSALSVLVMKPETPPSYSASLDSSPNAIIYVPDNSVDTYKAAAGWTSLASRIRSVSQLANDNAAIYNDIKEYL